MKRLALLFSLLLSAVLTEAASVVNWRGEVELKKSGAAVWQAVAGDKLPLGPGDELRTARASFAEIIMDDGTKVKIAPASSFKLSAETGEAVSLGLFYGRVRSWVKKFSKKFEVRTPSAVCAVRGTDYLVEVKPDGSTSSEVYEGSVLVGDAAGNTTLLREGQAIEVPMGGGLGQPQDNPNPPSDMEATVGDARQQARKEIYSEIAKEAVIARAQEEMQSAEFQSRKTAIDAFGNRVRMEEYTIRPSADQFKYVVLNTRDSRFDFGKILFTFNKALPADLSLATRNMVVSPGAAAPEWFLTSMNSVMSNTTDKVTEDALGGSMVSNGLVSAPEYQLVFGSYKFYAAGPAEANLNGGLGKEMWAKTNYNLATGASTNITYLGASGNPAPTVYAAGDIFHSVGLNTYSDGTWIAAEDFLLFDDGKILAPGDFGAGLGGGETFDSITDRLNFERVYTSSLFGGRKIDLEYSAKLLKDIGLLRF